MGLIDTPESGVDRIRAKLDAVMRQRPAIVEWLDWPRGQRDEDRLRDFAAGANGVLTIPELNFLARAFFGRFVEVDPGTAMLKSNAPAPETIGRGPDPYNIAAATDTYPPRIAPGITMRLYPRPEAAENKPARLQHSGWT
jgi:hypothetical protein